MPSSQPPRRIYPPSLRHSPRTAHLPTHTHRTSPQQCHTYPPLVTAAIALSTSHPCHLDIYAASPHHLDADHAPGRGLPVPQHDVSNHTAHPTQALLCGPTSTANHSLLFQAATETLSACITTGAHHRRSPPVTSMQRTSHPCYSLL
nr:hypothetical protein L204_00605 [Cryptococcus depauperatus CBS 7855]